MTSCATAESTDIINATEPHNRQVGGSHYKAMAIQPVDFCRRNHLDYCESAAIKYICRHHDKGGIEDIRKAIHYLELLLSIEYSFPPPAPTP